MKRNVCLWGAGVLALVGLSLLAVGVARPAESGPPPQSQHNLGTYSIVALDPENGDLGVAVASKFFAAASIVPSAKWGVGAVATQAFANATYGPRGIELLEQGLSAEEVVKRLIAEDPEGGDRRQLAVVDAHGRVANHTGSKCTSWAGAVKSEHRPHIYSAQGNILESEAVVKAMGRAFESAEGELADKLMAALEAAEASGGDHRGRQSAGMLVVRKGAGFNGFTDRYIDIRVDDHPEPLPELRRLLARAHVIAHIFRSIEYDKTGDLEGVIRELEQALARDPNYPDSHYSLAGAYARTGETVRALAELQKALALNPKLKTLAGMDPNLKSLKENPEYQRLVGASEK